MLRLQLEVLLLLLVTRGSLPVPPRLFACTCAAKKANVTYLTILQAVENENREVSGDDTDEDGDGTGAPSPPGVLSFLLLFTLGSLARLHPRNETGSAREEERGER